MAVHSDCPPLADVVWKLHSTTEVNHYGFSLSNLILQSSSVKILYAIDIQNTEEVKQNIKNNMKKKFKYHIKSIYNRVNNKNVILLNKNDYLPTVDLMLVTDYIYISTLKNKIPKVYKSIYPITELFDM